MLGDLRADIPEIADIAIAAKKTMSYFERMAESNDQDDRESALTMLDLLGGFMEYIADRCRYTIMQHETQENRNEQ